VRPTTTKCYASTARHAPSPGLQGLRPAGLRREEPRHPRAKGGENVRGIQVQVRQACTSSLLQRFRDELGQVRGRAWRREIGASQPVSLHLLAAEPTLPRELPNVETVLESIRGEESLSPATLSRAPQDAMEIASRPATTSGPPPPRGASHRRAVYLRGGRGALSRQGGLSLPRSRGQSSYAARDSL
jgi:hypothetical protein